MPQKLIRLTCESNDGIFNGKFDEDIFIKKDSEMAFQSLTLEQTPDILNVSNSNDTMSFVSRIFGVERQEASIPRGVYEKSDRDILLRGMTDALNGVCDMVARPTQMNSQWLAILDDIEEDKTEIQVRTSPFFPLAVFNTFGGANVPLYNTETVLDSPVVAGVANAATPEMGVGGLIRQTQSAAGLFNECYAYSSWPFIQSTGSWRIQLGVMTQGVDNRPAFTIGMVNADGYKKLQDATIELSDLLYAIQVNQNSADLAQGGYAYVNRLDEGAVTPTNPFVKIEKATGDATRASNDVLEIVIRNNKLQGYIHQLTGGRTDLPESLPLPLGASLFPVVFIHLASTAGPVVNNTIRSLQCSLDPFYAYIPGNDKVWVTILEDNAQLEPFPNDLPTTLLYDPPTGMSTIRYTPDFSLEKQDIAFYLGFDNPLLVEYDPILNFSRGVGANFAYIPDVTLTDPLTGNAYTQDQGYILGAKQVSALALDGDSFLIDTQTFMLDSYDSYGLTVNERNANSGGSRRNILSTIPHQNSQAITGTDNTRIIYEPNTLDYIAIRNKSDIITRQLRMRLLDSRYGPVITVGMATMTVLIRDPD